MATYDLRFDDVAFRSLDDLALLARQDYNLGNAGDWFGCFRGGLYGFYARLYGVTRHYKEVHEWIRRPRVPTEIEYHLASVLFNADSALECFVFALNGLGYSASPGDFLDVTDRRALTRIKPANLTEEVRQGGVLGHTNFFPTVQKHWREQQELIKTITDQHDVSKHRQTTYVGGQRRVDPPPGFYDSVGEDGATRMLLAPEAEILLMPDPKAPGRPTVQREEMKLLETVIPDFVALINATGVAALADARARITLRENQLRE